MDIEPILKTKKSKLNRTMTPTIYKGISKKLEEKRWQAHFFYNKRYIYLGTFDTELEAAIAYTTKYRNFFNITT